MAKEIERKFLVTDTRYRQMATRKTEISQGYLSRRREATVRVRIAGDRAYLTVKGPNDGAVRDEWEFEIAADEAAQMLARVAEPPVLSKTRYYVPGGDGLTWEIDEFHGLLEGLCLAEVELPSADTVVTPPPFIGREVTGDPAYYNSNLTARPQGH